MSVATPEELNEREVDAVRIFVKAMLEITIPAILREQKAREEAWREMLTKILD